MRKITKQLGFDSDEEYFLSEWFRELGIEYEYQPEPWLLSPSFKLPIQKPRSIGEAHLLHSHTYGADFKIRVVLERLGDYLFSIDISQLPIQESLKNALFIACGDEILTDCKGSNFMGSSRSSDVRMPLNQKWVYDKYKVYVNSVVPDKLFAKTFFPEVYFYTENGADRFKKIKGEKVLLKDLYKKVGDVLQHSK
jgi:hypothetical protein